MEPRKRKRSVSSDEASPPPSYHIKYHHDNNKLRFLVFDEHGSRVHLRWDYFCVNCLEGDTFTPQMYELLIAKELQDIVFPMRESLMKEWKCATLEFAKPVLNTPYFLRMMETQVLPDTDVPTTSSIREQRHNRMSLHPLIVKELRAGGFIRSRSASDSYEYERYKKLSQTNTEWTAMYYHVTPQRFAQRHVVTEVRFPENHYEPTFYIRDQQWTDIFILDLQHWKSLQNHRFLECDDALGFIIEYETGKLFEGHLHTIGAKWYIHCNVDGYVYEFGFPCPIEHTCILLDDIIELLTVRREDEWKQLGVKEKTDQEIEMEIESGGLWEKEPKPPKETILEQWDEGVDENENDNCDFLTRLHELTAL